MIVDLEADPFVPDGLEVVSHRRGPSQLLWGPQVVEFHTEPLRDGRNEVISGILDKLKQLPVANANLLDFLLRNQNLVPKEWWGLDKFDSDPTIGTIDFSGTVYRWKWGRHKGSLCVRTMVPDAKYEILDLNPVPKGYVGPWYCEQYPIMRWVGKVAEGPLHGVYDEESVKYDCFPSLLLMKG